MRNKTSSTPWSRVFAATVMTPVLAGSTWLARADFTLGPLNPGFELGSQNWNASATGSGSENFVSFANQPTNGPSAPGVNCVLQSSDGSGNADLRADYFSLGAAMLSTNGISIDFDYNIPGSINFGDQIRVGMRFEDSGGGFLGEYNFHLGTPNNDVGGTGWHHFHGVATDPTLTAVNMDVRITMNIFGDDTWSSGPVLYDNFSVTAAPNIGPNYNGDFENAGANWNAGGPGGAGGSENFYNATNGPSAPGTNSVMMTADGTVSPSGGNDLRVNNFYLGPATHGNSGVSVDFDYDILGPINFGDQIRIGLRFENSGGGFLGENNFHLGTPNNDVGGTGWHHFHGVAVDPTRQAVTADLRLSMNIFGDDVWGSGPVLFDNFVVQGTPAIGPNHNGDFENGNGTWNTGGPGGTAGSANFANYPTNGWSRLGSNCVLMTADGTVSPPNGNDLRVNEFELANNSQPVTISFDYNILNPVNSGNQVRVGLRFFDSNNNFNGEHNTYIGTPNGDTGGQGWKHLSATYPVPAGSVQADIRISMNIFGDDIWSSGPVLFDNFVVITGTNVPLTAGDITMGTLTNLPVARPVATGAVAEGVIESDGIIDYWMPSFFTQPAHGTAAAAGMSVVYTPTNSYVGMDSFTFGVSDGLGGLATAAATVQVNANAGANRFILAPGGAPGMFTFSGAPYVDYVLESASSFTPPIVWTPASTNTANASGSVTFTNVISGPSGFWRTRLLP